MDKKTLEKFIMRISNRENIIEEILEKDYYVCLVLKELSLKQEKIKAYFKGGTAVYKVLDHMNRFSEDIDLTVKVINSDSNNSNKTRLKKSALGYHIEGLTLLKDRTIDNKGSVTAFYEYESVFNDSKLFKSKFIQVESTSFTVSEPTTIYTIEPLIYKYATESEKLILKSKYNICEFDIETITLERIFIDKVFAVEFYYQRKMYKDVSKHLYDITVLLSNSNILKLLDNKDELLKLLGYKRDEEKVRFGGIDESQKVCDFGYMKCNFDREFIDTFNNMQKIYVLDDASILSFDEVKKKIEFLLNIFSKLEL